MMSAMSMGGKRSKECHNWAWMDIVPNALRNRGGVHSWD